MKSNKFNVFYKYINIKQLVKNIIMKITCVRCGKSFAYEKQFLNHLNKNNKCKHKYIVIPKKHYANNYKIYNPIFEPKFKELVENNNTQIKYGCIGCGELYNSDAYYYTHKKKYCKWTIKISEIPENKIIDTTNNSNQITNNCNQSNNTNALYSQYGNNNITNNTNSNNTITNNVNNVNNISTINNIYIKDFNSEKEDINKLISKKDQKKILLRPYCAITDIHKKIHLDNEEYRNVLIKDVKDSFGFILQDGEWKAFVMKELLEELLVKHSNTLFEIFNGIDIKQSYKDKVTNILNKISENGNIAHGIKLNLKADTYNMKSHILDTYNNSINKKLKLIPKNKK